ncbi:secretion protein HlyD [Cellulomonas sp. Y8]|uniref:secretion protein HlyD n=1 Tax=Cellulomonas sp. Y8 TaxID=2591145 RepID=UPI003D748B73
MGVTRRIVFPAIRIVLWAVIAVALAKIAFAGADRVSAAEDPLQPSAQVTEPQVQVTTGTVTNAVTVSASVVADAPKPVRATLAGTVHRLLAEDGQAVAADTPVLELRSETPVDPTVTTDPETGMQTVTENKPKVTRQTVVAGTAGTLRLSVLKDQVVAVGDSIGTVTPGTLSVQGTLTPDQQYRLVDAPGEATVTLKGGPAPFTCTGLRIGAAAQDEPTDPQAPEAGASTSGTVSCAVPGEVTAFPGLGADIEIVNGTAEGALVVPVTAVQGSVQNGNVWVVGADGASEQRAVVLGLTDGKQVQIAEGLAEGDTVLEYAPVSSLTDVDCTDPATADPNVCGG